MLMTSPRKIVSWILGVLILALGSLPLLSKFGVIPFSITGIPALVVWVLLVIGGIFLLLDGFKEWSELYMGVMWVSILVGVVILALGVIPILGSLGIITFVLPNIAEIILEVVYVIAGILLIIGGFMGF